MRGALYRAGHVVNNQAAGLAPVHTCGYHSVVHGRHALSRLSRRRRGVLGALAVLGVATAAPGRPMDPSLSRLVVDPNCGVAPAPACEPDRAAFHQLVNQLGFAFAPHSPHGARTTGLSGLDVALFGAFTPIRRGADYWQRGTEGPERPEAWLSHYAVEVRKGFGFGIEATASLGFMPNTSLVSWGGDLRVALLEGFRHGTLRYFPDVSLGLGARRVTGSSELSLGTLAFDARFSKPFSVPSRFIVTPWIGYQWLRIDAAAENVDLTPAEDPLQSCGYTGNNVPRAGDEGAGTPASGAPEGVFDGSPLCSEGAGGDFVHDASFGQAEVFRHRVLVGASYQWELLKVGAEFAADLLEPDAAQTDSAVKAALRCGRGVEGCEESPRQWTLSLRVGAAF